MVVHVVLFRPKASVSPDERKALAQAFETAVRAIPSVRRAQVGRRVRHGAGYEALPQPDLQYAALLEFDDLAGLTRSPLRPDDVLQPAHQARRLAADIGESLQAIQGFGKREYRVNLHPRRTGRGQCSWAAPQQER